MRAKRGSPIDGVAIRICPASEECAAGGSELVSAALSSVAGNATAAKAKARRADQRQDTEQHPMRTAIIGRKADRAYRDLGGRHSW